MNSQLLKSSFAFFPNWHLLPFLAQNLKRGITVTLILLLLFVHQNITAQYTFSRESVNQELISGRIVEGENSDLFFLTTSLNPLTGLTNYSSLVSTDANGAIVGEWVVLEDPTSWHRGLWIVDISDNIATVLVHRKSESCKTIIELNQIDLVNRIVTNIESSSFCDIHIEKFKGCQQFETGLLSHGYLFQDGLPLGYICLFNSDGRLDTMMVDFDSNIGIAQSVALTDSGFVIGDGALYNFYDSRLENFRQTLIYDNQGYFGSHQHRMYYPGNRILELLSNYDYKVRIANAHGRTILSTTFDALDQGNLHYVPWQNGIDYVYPNNIFATGGYQLDLANNVFESDIPNVFSVVRLDSTLQVLNHHIVDVTNTFMLPRGVKATEDGGCLVHGVKYIKGQNRPIDLFVMKFDSLARFITTSTFNIPKGLTNINIFPNPGSSELNITIDNLSEHSYHLELYSTTGQLVHSEFISNSKSIINTTKLISGNYIYRLINGSGQQIGSGKWVKI